MVRIEMAERLRELLHQAMSTGPSLHSISWQYVTRACSCEALGLWVFSTFFF